MSQPPDPVPETDKPFILVLILLVAILLFGFYGVYRGTLDINNFLNAVLPLLGLGLGLYFKSKA